MVFTMATLLIMFRPACTTPQTSTAITSTSQKRAEPGKQGDCPDHLQLAAGTRPDTLAPRITLPKMARPVFICSARNAFGAHVQTSITAESAGSCNLAFMNPI